MGLQWLSVSVGKYDALSFPDFCPTCGARPVEGSVNLQRTLWIPGVVRVTYHMEWPHCAQCARYFTERPKLLNHFLAHLLATALVLGVISGAVCYAWRYSPWILLGALALFGFPATWLARRFARAYWAIHPSPGANTRRPGVKLVRCGKTFLGGKHFCSIRFARPEYAIEFVRLNAGKNNKLTFNKKQFRRALAEDPSLMPPPEPDEGAECQSVATPESNELRA